MTNRVTDKSTAGLRPWILRAANRRFPVRDSNARFNTDNLIKASRSATGLHDLGEDFDRAALEVLVNSINTEARLSRIGAFIMKTRLEGALALRLRAIDLMKRYPEILEQEIAPIWLITGLQRTGTTFLQRVLSEDPEVRPLLSWEALDPVPRGGRHERKRRIRSARLSARTLKWMAPGFFAIHPILPEQPEEDVLLLDGSFHTTAPEAILNVPSYASWLGQQDPKYGYHWEKKMLQILQWQRPAKRWVLKSPHHLEFLEEFTSVFPRAHVIWTHRDPVECVPSFMSMLYHGRSVFSDDVRIPEINEHWLRKLENMLDSAKAFRGRRSEGLTDVRFEDLGSNLEGVAEDIYEGAGATLSGEQLAAITAASGRLKRHRYGIHRYTPDEFHLSEELLKARFGVYREFIQNLADNERG